MSEAFKEGVSPVGVNQNMLKRYLKYPILHALFIDLLFTELILLINCAQHLGTKGLVGF